MFFKIVKNDCLRKKAVTFTVFVFIVLAVLLGASATNIIASLVNSINQFKQAASPAELTQMHLGSYDQMKVDEFFEKYKDDIAMQETMTLLNIEGMNIYYDEYETFAGTIQDISFAVQNEQFDFLLDLDNQKLDVKEGYIAVPIYFMQLHGLAIGDTLKVRNDTYEKSFIISDYVRDYEMNSTFATSKRFIINQADFDKLYQQQLYELEYLIQFKLQPDGDLRTVQDAYIDAMLPANGPAIPGQLYTMLIALSDAAIAMVIIFISILLIIIAIFCIRLTFLATFEEDIKEIGVMKAMGISKRDVKKVYLSKYRFMCIAAGIVGYIGSFFAVNLFNENMRLYLSSDSTGMLKFFLSLLAPLLVYVMIVTSCKNALRRIDKISAVAALRSDFLDGKNKNRNSFGLLKNKIFTTNIYMGFRDVWKRFRLYWLVLLIFSVCTFILILPINFYNTINSSQFATYLGIGISDMRIDLRRTNTIEDDLLVIEQELNNDPDIEQYSTYITCAYQMLNAEGSWDYINIEVGDFSAFPLKYLEGEAPQQDGEIALSYANSGSGALDKSVGDELVIRVGGKEQKYTVCGIYQDITNGGKTAKAYKTFSLNMDSVLWYVININVADGVNISEKMSSYQLAHETAQINDINEYIGQTVGAVVDQLSNVVIGGVVISLLVVSLITALFIKMLLSKDRAQIAIMRGLGLTTSNIKHQYMVGIITILVLGIIAGSVLSQNLGGVLVSAAFATMGASKIEFVNVMLHTLILCPLGLLIAVWFTASVCCNMTVEKDLSVVLRS